MGRPAAHGLRELPLHVRFMPGESTGSYVTRLARRNGLDVQQLLDLIGEGRTKVVAPHLTELYLSPPAAERLAVLAGRPLTIMQRALASLNPQYLLPVGSDVPIWAWPWTPQDGYLVRGCTLCAARRGVSEPPWLMLPDPWLVCAQHGRWMDASRDQQFPWLPVHIWDPQVVRAERDRQRLVARMGDVGRALFADAMILTARSASTRGWLADRLGERRVAPLLAYPHAVRLARVFARAERRRLANELTREWYDRWAQQARRELGAGTGPWLVEWMSHHDLRHVRGPGDPSRRGAAASAKARSRRLPPIRPHAAAAPLDSVMQLSCVAGEVGPGNSFDRPFL